MELRKVDPRILLEDPNNTRRTQVHPAYDDQLLASIIATGGPVQPRDTLGVYYDWRRLRRQAIEPLRAGREVTFRRFDGDRGRGLDGLVTVRPGALIVVEGVFSAAPELAGLVDRSVLVDTPEPERLRRLRDRIAPEDWDNDWLAAEQAYFGHARPPACFDLVVAGEP